MLLQEQRMKMEMDKAAKYAKFEEAKLEYQKKKDKSDRKDRKSVV